MLGYNTGCPVLGSKTVRDRKKKKTVYRSQRLYGRMPSMHIRQFVLSVTLIFARTIFTRCRRHRQPPTPAQSKWATDNRCARVRQCAMHTITTVSEPATLTMHNKYEQNKKKMVDTTTQCSQIEVKSIKKIQNYNKIGTETRQQQKNTSASRSHTS